MKKTIIIDNIPENFKLQPNNGFEIKTWMDDIKDTHLLDLCKVLDSIHGNKVNDVRDVVKKINEEINTRIKKGISNYYSDIDILNL